MGRVPGGVEVPATDPDAWDVNGNGFQPICEDEYFAMGEEALGG